MDSPDLTSTIYYENDNLILLSTLEPLNDKNEDENELFNENMICKSTLPYILQPIDFTQTDSTVEMIYQNVKEEQQTKVVSLQIELKTCNIDHPQYEIVYKTKDIESLVEKACNYDFELKDKMVEEYCYLTKVISQWRRVLNDGNSYYRSIIFSWLEYLIFNHEIDIFKIIIADFKVKFNASYINKHKLSAKTQQELLSILNHIPITLMIIECIISQLSKEQSTGFNQKKEAYITLIKAYNFCKRFDIAMIYYLRFLLYEFILDNEYKTYSKDMDVEIGKLLPPQYQSHDNKFLFQNYYEENLLKYYTAADKLAIYLTPFVLKLNLVVVHYKSGNDSMIRRKFFSSFLPNKDSLHLLFSKAHYDICYSIEYCKKYNELLSVHIEKKTSQIIQEKDVNEFIKKMETIDLNKTEVFLKKKEVNSDNLILNQLNLMKERMSQYKKCILCSQLIKESETRLLVFPCKCELNLCSDTCLHSLIKSIINIIEEDLLKRQFKCPVCLIDCSIDKLIEIGIIIKNNFNNTDIIDTLQTRLTNIFNTQCMLCLLLFNETDKKYQLTVKCPMFGSLFEKNKCLHFLCLLCRKKQPLICQICSCYHSRIIDK